MAQLHLHNRETAVLLWCKHDKKTIWNTEIYIKVKSKSSMTSTFYKKYNKRLQFSYVIFSYNISVKSNILFKICEIKSDFFF